mgnify:CR=1 FL=1
MAEETTILQHWVLTKFILPFLLVFFIVFAVLQKTKLLGDGKKQLDALVSFVIGLIFVGAVFPKLVVGNLILFMTVSLVIVFVILILWGFATGGEAKIESKGMKWLAGIILFVAVVIAVLWATGYAQEVSDLLFSQNWSNTFWTSVSFIVVIAIALAMILKGSGK